MLFESFVLEKQQFHQFMVVNYSQSISDLDKKNYTYFNKKLLVNALYIFQIAFNLESLEKRENYFITLIYDNLFYHLRITSFLRHFHANVNEPLRNTILYCCLIKHGICLQHSQKLYNINKTSSKREKKTPSKQKSYITSSKKYNIPFLPRYEVN